MGYYLSLKKQNKTKKTWWICRVGGMSRRTTTEMMISETIGSVSWHLRERSTEDSHILFPTGYPEAEVQLTLWLAI